MFEYRIDALAFQLREEGPPDTSIFDFVFSAANVYRAVVHLSETGMLTEARLHNLLLSVEGVRVV